MTAGIYVSGSSGAVQIDSSFRNPTLIASGTLSLTSSDGSYGWTKNVVVTGYSPIVAIGAVTETWSAAAVARSVSGNTWTITIKAGRRNPSGICTVSYYIYDFIPSSASSYGIQVFDSAGALVFDAQKTPMKIHTIWQPTVSNQSIDLPSGNWAAILSCSPYFMEQVSGSFSMCFSFATNVTSNSAYVSIVPVGPAIPQIMNTNPVPNPGQMVVIDLS